MDWLVYFGALFLSAIGIVAVLCGPFLIGDDTGKYTAWKYLYDMIQAAAAILVLGRIIGWW